MSQHRFRDQRRGAACFSFFFSGTVKHAAGKNTFSTSVPSHTSLVEREREKERGGGGKMDEDGTRTRGCARLCAVIAHGWEFVRAKRRSRLLSHCAGARAREVELVSETVAMLPPSFPMRFFFLFWCAKIARFRLEIIFNEKVYFKQTPCSYKAVSFNGWYDVIMSY